MPNENDYREAVPKRKPGIDDLDEKLSSSRKQPCQLNDKEDSSPERQAPFFARDSSAGGTVDGTHNRIDPELAGLTQLQALTGTDSSIDQLRRLFVMCGNDLNKAANTYYEDPEVVERLGKPKLASNSPAYSSSSTSRASKTAKATAGVSQMSITNRRYYIGELLVKGFSSVSGPFMAKAGDEICLVPDQKIEPKRFASRQTNSILRFKTLQGRELGRLPTDYAKWMCILLFEKICTFRTFVVYADDRVRVGDDIYIRVKAYFTGERSVLSRRHLQHR